MAHRKFRAPRHGSLGFLPRKRCTRARGRIKAFPKDVPTVGVNEEMWSKKEGVHLTGFIGFKAGMKHILRDFQRQGIKVITLEACEPVTVIETPKMKVIGIVGYVNTVRGIRPYKTIWSRNIGEEARRRLCSNWYKSKKNAFKHHRYTYNSVKSKREREIVLKSMQERCDIIRVLANTQPKKMGHGVKRAHIMEIQCNGGTSVADKIAYAQGLLGKEISVNDVFKKDDMCDVIGITRGKGFKGVVSRVGVKKLPRKTHKGLRKVACIGAWHPAKVTIYAARAGQKGVFHRVSTNRKIYKIGEDATTEAGKTGGMTKMDLTRKDINPISGFHNYGFVKNEFIVVKGPVFGPTRSAITLRKTLKPNKNRRTTEVIEVKFYDTASVHGRGRFQTSEEKLAFFGPTKKQKEAKRQAQLDALKKKMDEEKTA